MVENQIDVYSKTFFGLTAACARCHDHKFDAITQEDFYALYGILASSRPGQVILDRPEALQAADAELSALKSSIKDGLAAAWLDAAGRFAIRLEDQRSRQARTAVLGKDLADVSLSIEAIERPARDRALELRGGEPGSAHSRPRLRGGAFPLTRATASAVSTASFWGARSFATAG